MSKYDVLLLRDFSSIHFEHVSIGMLFSYKHIETPDTMENNPNLLILHKTGTHIHGPVAALSLLGHYHCLCTYIDGENLYRDSKHPVGKKKVFQNVVPLSLRSQVPKRCT